MGDGQPRGDLPDDPPLREENPSDVLREIWAEVLDLAEVPDDKGFLDLGGDSIAATLCVMRIRELFDVDVPMGSLLTDGMTITRLMVELRSLPAAEPPEVV